MKDIQLLHKGKVYHGLIGYETDFMEIELSASARPAFECGEKVLCFDFKSRQIAVVLHKSPAKVILAPVDSELFQIKARPNLMTEELFGDERETVHSYKLNTFGTISEDFKTRAVRFSDVSRYGLGFEIEDFTVKLNEMYESTIFCDDEAIRMKLIVRYAHIKEKTIRYGSEIHYISPADLTKFRYYIVMHNFKQLMLV
ncbi:PilZ domain-containing protein [Paenibacillus piri]|uniref:PilZ domain-containing protein n=1 Tax=Paenibacillus piri TaxID=2547395 RepID=A0A4R5KX66_9BACL|nr:PilZ domain-containing protein [Paenibacillus piri]TDG00624.1 hypothetical protein E1757_03075 [Paenibacillus piri]